VATAQDGMVILTIMINMNNYGRRLQMLGAPVIQTIQSNMNATSNISTDLNGYYNYSDIVTRATSTGLAPPTKILLTQVSPWLYTIGPSIKISQLSSVQVVGTFSIPLSNTLESMQVTSLANSINPANANILGAILGSLCIVGAVGLSIFLVYRRREQKNIPKKPTYSSAPIIAYTNKTMMQKLVTKPTRNDYEPTHVREISKEMKQKLIAHTAIDISEPSKTKEPVRIVSEQQRSAANYLKHYKSTPNLMEVMPGAKPAVSVQDTNGRRAFISNIPRAIKPSITPDVNDTEVEEKPVIQHPKITRNQSEQTMLKVSDIRKVYEKGKSVPIIPLNNVYVGRSGFKQSQKEDPPTLESDLTEELVEHAEEPAVEHAEQSAVEHAEQSAVEKPKKKKSRRTVTKEDDETPKKRKSSRTVTHEDDETPKKKKSSRTVKAEDDETPKKKKSSRTVTHEDDETPKKKKSSRIVQSDTEIASMEDIEA
jgi:hypothetical protein